MCFVGERSRVSNRPVLHLPPRKSGHVSLSNSSGPSSSPNFDRRDRRYLFSRSEIDHVHVKLSILCPGVYWLGPFPPRRLATQVGSTRTARHVPPSTLHECHGTWRGTGEPPVRRANTRMHTLAATRSVRPRSRSSRHKVLLTQQCCCHRIAFACTSAARLALSRFTAVMLGASRAAPLSNMHALRRFRWGWWWVSKISARRSERLRGSEPTACFPGKVVLDLCARGRYPLRLWIRLSIFSLAPRLIRRQDLGFGSVGFQVTRTLAQLDHAPAASRISSPHGIHQRRFIAQSAHS